jgi:hypothetical protein
VLCLDVYKTLQELALGLRLQAEDCFQSTVRDISRIGYETFDRVPQLKDIKPELWVLSTHMGKGLHGPFEIYGYPDCHRQIRRLS